MCGIIFVSLAKIQSLRTFYREELRKVKKSQGTGTGSYEVYRSKWKFFDECSFLDEVISSNRPTCSNITDESNQSVPAECDLAVSEEEIDSKSESSISLISDGGDYFPKRKRSSDSPFLESAATALNKIAKGASSDEDEWDTFGKDVANSLRGLTDKDLQRRVKFAVQSAIFQTSEPRRPTYPPYNYTDESYHGFTSIN